MKVTVLSVQMRYNSLWIDKLSLRIIQQLCVCDILYSIIVVIPTAVTAITGDWVLGHVVCYIQAQVSSELFHFYQGYKYLTFINNDVRLVTFSCRVVSVSPIFSTVDASYFEALSDTKNRLNYKDN